MQEVVHCTLSMSGSYRVQPAPMPSSRSTAMRVSSLPMMSRSTAMRFSLGAPKSHEKMLCGVFQLPANEMRMGMMKRKIMPRPCRVMALLYTQKAVESDAL